MRDRLIKLLKGFNIVCSKGCLKFDCNTCAFGQIADHILADGWIRPPCKVGDITYIFDYEVNNHLEMKSLGITPSVVEAITILDDGLWIENEHAKYHISSVGDLIFLTREEAEQKLKEMSQ